MATCFNLNHIVKIVTTMYIYLAITKVLISCMVAYILKFFTKLINQAFRTHCQFFTKIIKQATESDADLVSAVDNMCRLAFTGLT